MNKPENQDGAVTTYLVGWAWRKNIILLGETVQRLEIIFRGFHCAHDVITAILLFVIILIEPRFLFFFQRAWIATEPRADVDNPARGSRNRNRMRLDQVGGICDHFLSFIPEVRFLHWTNNIRSITKNP